MTGNAGGGGHLRAHQMGPPAAALAALEIAIGGRSATFAFGELVRIHPEAHRTTRFAPFEPGIGEHTVEAFCFGLLLDQP